MTAEILAFSRPQLKAAPDMGFRAKAQKTLDRIRERNRAIERAPVARCVHDGKLYVVVFD